MAEKKQKKPIAKRIGVTKKFSFIGLDKKEHTLTEQQKKFAEIYSDPQMGSVQAVLGAGYDCRNKKGGINMQLVYSIASENLRKPNICQYIATLIDASGLNDNVVDKHLLFNITQFDDLRAKNTAIDIYNKMKRRYGNSEIPPINAPATQREADLTFSLLKRLGDYQRQSANTDLPDA